MHIFVANNIHIGYADLYLNNCGAYIEMKYDMNLMVYVCATLNIFDIQESQALAICIAKHVY